MLLDADGEIIGCDSEEAQEGISRVPFATPGRNLTPGTRLRSSSVPPEQQSRRSPQRSPATPSTPASEKKSARLYVSPTALEAARILCREKKTTQSAIIDEALQKTFPAAWRTASSSSTSAASQAPLLPTPQPARTAEATSAAHAIKTTDERLAKIRFAVLRWLSVLTSVAKIPEILMLSSLYFFGLVNVGDIACASQVSTLLRAINATSLDTLKRDLADVPFIHVLFDTSKRQQLDRFPIFILFFLPKTREYTFELISSLALPNGEAKTIAKSAFSALKCLGIAKKVCCSFYLFFSFTKKSSRSNL